jgi:hypothetical protein
MTMDAESIGATIRLYSTDTEDVGVVTAPSPVEPGELCRPRTGPPLRVVCVVPLVFGGRVDYLVEVEEALPEGVRVSA